MKFLRKVATFFCSRLAHSGVTWMEPRDLEDKLYEADYSKVTFHSLTEAFHPTNNKPTVDPQ